MKDKVQWFILTNDDGSITIASSKGVRVEANTPKKARKAFALLVQNTADVFASLIEMGTSQIKFTVEY